MRIIENKNRIKGIGFVLIASLGYGLMPSISQLAFANGVNFDTMLANRYIIALSVTWAYIFFKRIPDTKKTREGEFRKHVNLKIIEQNGTTDINMDKLKEYADILERFISETKQFLSV